MKLCDDAIHCDCSCKLEEMEAQRDELLEALEELFYLIDDAHDGERVFTFEMQRKARAVIAKAKGE